MVREEPTVNQYTNQFEKELKRIMKESNYSNVNMIFMKFYKQSKRPERLAELFSDEKFQLASSSEVRYGKFQDSCRMDLA